LIDKKMANQLKDIKNPILLCDPDGHVVGRVIPPSPYDELVVPFTEEELRKAEEESEEFSLKEILSGLQKQ
jgi:hypothetical protein